MVPLVFLRRQTHRWAWPHSFVVTMGAQGHFTQTWEERVNMTQVRRGRPLVCGRN